MKKRVKDIWQPSPSVPELFKLLSSHGKEEAQFRFELSMVGISPDFGSQCNILKTSRDAPKTNKHLVSMNSGFRSPFHRNTIHAKLPKSIKTPKNYDSCSDFSWDEFARLDVLIKFDDDSKRLV